MKDQAINQARAVYYGMFSRFFVYSQNTSRYFELLNMIKILKDNPLDASTSEALASIESKLGSDSNVALIQEHDDIFYNPSSTTIRITASFYDEQIESGKKRLEMLDFMAKTKIRRDEKVFTENEDSLGFIFTMMSELITLVTEGEEQYNTLQHCMFTEILNDFVDQISREIYEHENANIYKDVIVVLQAFMEFERLYLEVSRPKLKSREEFVKVYESECEITEEEKARRAKNKALRESGPKKPKEEVFVTYEVESDI
jgi:TorA maturation chaperone TorD